MTWEIVSDDGDRVRRCRVPGGWLYQVESITNSESSRCDSHRTYTYGWHPPVFVPGGEP